MEFNIIIPSIEEPVCCFGEVCRIDKTAGEIKGKEMIHVYKIAARFTDMETDKIEKIDNFIRKVSPK